MRILVTLLILLPFCQGLLAQDETDSYVPIDSMAVTKKVRIVGLPIAFFTPETNFGFGGGAQIFLLRKSNVYNLRKSNILVSGIYTLNNQIMVDIRS